MDARATPLRCALCADDAFDPVDLPGTAQPTGLLVCRGCRRVRAPPARPPAASNRTPLPSDLTRDRPGGRVR